MNDLSGLNWTSGPAKNAQPNRQDAAMRPPVPSLSRGPSPLSSSRATTGTAATSAVKNSGQDSFASLLAPNAAKKANGLTLQEKQRQLQEEKAKKNQELYRSDDSAFWDGLGSGKGTQAPFSPPASSVREQIIVVFD